MSKNLQIKSQGQLEALLKLIAEESVYAAYDETGRQEKIASDIKRATKPGGYYVKEEDAPPPGAAPSDPAPAPAAEAPPEEPAAEDSAETVGSVDVKDIKRVLNQLRAGKSLDDSAVEGPLESFVTSMQDAEKKAAYVIINSIAKILNVQKVADSPLKSAKLVVTSEEAPAAAAPEAPAPEAGGAPAAPEAGIGAAAPIKVGEPPVTEAFRQKIRQIIRGV